MQLSIFDISNENINNSVFQDIRTEKQERNKISYDIGEEISGAAKHLVENRKKFLAKPSIEVLKGFEDEDVATAAELVTRNTFFNWFSFEDCKERGVEPMVAKGLQLLIHRIVQSPADTRQAREHYTTACLYVSDILSTIKTMADFQDAESKIYSMILHEYRAIKRFQQKIESDKEALQYEHEEEYIKALQSRIEKSEKQIELMKAANELHLSSLGDKFRNYFIKHSSRKGSYQTMAQLASWDDLLKPTKNITKSSKRKPVWERSLPERPDRKGGQIISVKTPEEFAAMFRFRGVQFGHYVGDNTGGDHLFRSAEAFVDLADILGISVPAVSLHGDLAISFGSRGRGRALGHYEPLHKVINLTKQRGSLGILAHEWFHALDHFLFSYSHKFQNGKVGYVSESENNPFIHHEIQVAFSDLLQNIKEGSTISTIDVSQRTGSYRVYSSFKERYRRFEGDFCGFMDEVLEEFDEKVATNLRLFSSSPSMYEKAKEKYAKQRKRTLKTNAEALAQIHEELTNEVLTEIPYTTDCSQYFQTAISLDKGSVGKYWSANVELVARAFEGYVYDELTKRGWVSDYLVCGVRDELFPQGEERERINKAMQSLIEVVKPILIDKGENKDELLF